MNRYDCIDGVLTWVEHHHKSLVGKPVGAMCNGYLRLRNQYVHRLLWQH